MATWMTRAGVCAAAGLLAAAPLLAADDPHGAGAGEHAKPDIFTGNYGNAVITLGILALLVWILGKYAWPPLLKVLDERERSIRESLERAKEEREASEKLLAQYQAQLDQARQEATAIVDEARRDAEEVRRRIQEEGRSESQQMIERARREIQLATDTAIKDLYDRFSGLAVEVAQGIIGKELKAADHDELIKTSLERIRSDAASRN